MPRTPDAENIVHLSQLRSPDHVVGELRSPENRVFDEQFECMRYLLSESCDMSWSEKCFYYEQQRKSFGSQNSECKWRIQKFHSVRGYKVNEEPQLVDKDGKPCQSACDYHPKIHSFLSRQPDHTASIEAIKLHLKSSFDVPSLLAVPKLFDTSRYGQNLANRQARVGPVVPVVPVYSGNHSTMVAVGHTGGAAGAAFGSTAATVAVLGNHMIHESEAKTSLIDKLADANIASLRKREDELAAEREARKKAEDELAAKDHELAELRRKVAVMEANENADKNAVKRHQELKDHVTNTVDNAAVQSEKRLESAMKETIEFFVDRAN